VERVDTPEAYTGAPVLGEPLPVELMNTVWADRDGVHDALRTPGGALAWLRAVGPRLASRAPEAAAWLGADRPAGLAEAAARLRELRDALRRLAAEATGDPRPAAESPVGDREAALAVLNRTCGAAPVRPVLRWPAGQDPTRAVHTDGPAGRALVAMLAGQAVDLFAGEARPLLRSCLAPGCVLYFVRSHPRREWCSGACGNRARVARHYRRHRAAEAGPPA
jgi:predicted RNA-binding Zn ribbon-like protein